MAQRRNFGKIETDLPKMDLSLIQRESWKWFLKEGIAEELKEISPIDDFTGKNWQLVLSEPSLEEPGITQKFAREKGLTYASPFKIIATLINKKNGEQV